MALGNVPERRILALEPRSSCSSRVHQSLKVQDHLHALMSKSEGRPTTDALKGRPPRARAVLVAGGAGACRAAE
eukprot:874946-Pleurochrysis_carterae.AAC.6